jgi:hypothetical protein
MIEVVKEGFSGRGRMKQCLSRLTEDMKAQLLVKLRGFVEGGEGSEARTRWSDKGGGS